MTTKTDGGSAFPQGKGAGYVWVSEGGMTLRDYFAAKAMQGIISLGSNYAYTKEDMDSGTPSDAIARYSYQVADAMLKERNR